MEVLDGFVDGIVYKNEDKKEFVPVVIIEADEDEI